LGDPAAPHAPPDVRWLAVPEAESQYPVLTEVMEGSDLIDARSRSTTGADRRMWAAVVAAATAVLALLATGAYLYSRTAPGGIFDSTQSADTAAGARGIGGVPGFVTPTNADPTNARSTPSSQAEASTSATAQALAAAARALAVKPSEATKATPAANTAGLADAQRAKVRGAMRSSSATTAAPKAATPEPPRQTPERLGPCTETVAALGLCTAPPTQSKE
jgi:hypothetical protein